jgi:hypothetical protein
VTSPPGNLLAGRYRTLKRLGSGGMATVLLAVDERLGRQVAVKRMHAESPEDVAKRFRREAQLGASLNHPNIVSIFDIETDEENVLIVMEYVPGGTLKDALARGPLPREAALKILRGVASAIDYAHEHDVVHRDIKPANILLDADGRAKLADLGIATAAEVTSITSTGAVLGTASYMPPERLDGQPGGPPADIYGLAVVAYETLTGRKARQGRSAVEIAAMVMSEPPPDLRTHVPDAPEEAARVLERGMARDPADRQATAGELVYELCRAFEDAEEPEETQPVVPASTATMPMGDNGHDTAAGGPDHTPRAVPQPTYRRHRAERRPAAAASSPGVRRGADGDRRWLIPVAALVVALIAVALILLLSGGGDDKGSGDSRSAGDVQGEQADGDSGSGSGNGGGESSGDPGAGGAGGAAGGSAGGGSGSAGGSGGGGADSQAAQTVSDFYTRAAEDDFDGAWELAGPGVRKQLGGFDSFKGTLDTLESIEFPVLKTTVQNGQNATVQLQSVAKHTDHTDRCSGTADVSGGDGNWKIDHLNVDCNQGTSGGSAPPQVTPGKGPAGGKPVKPKKEKPKKG